MKNLFAYATLICGLMFLCSCEKEEIKEEPAEEMVETSFDVKIPLESATKTVSMGESTDVVYFEVWDEDFAKRLFPYPGSEENVAKVNGRSAQITLDLVKDQYYNLIFWAQNRECGAYSWADLKEIKVDYTKFTQDQKDVYDAFYKVEKILANGETKSIYLTRPFAQVNFGASQMSSSLGQVTLKGNWVEISEVASGFNTVEGKGIKPVQKVKFSTKADFVEDRTIIVENQTFNWVAMNYLLVSSTDVMVTAEFDTNFGKITHVVHNVPIDKNHKTNIVGNLFTTGAKLKIIVKEDFVKPEIPPVEIY